MRMSASLNVLVKAKLVNCEISSLWKIAGSPKRAIASSSVETQNLDYIVFDSLQLRTFGSTSP